MKIVVLFLHHCFVIFLTFAIKTKGELNFRTQLLEIRSGKTFSDYLNTGLTVVKQTSSSKKFCALQCLKKVECCVASFNENDLTCLIGYGETCCPVIEDTKEEILMLSQSYVPSICFGCVEIGSGCYLFSETKRTWLDAMDECSGLGGKLFEIETNSDFDFIIPQLVKRNNENKTLSVDCKKSVLGTKYAGNVNVTENGLACQAWSSESPHQHEYHENDNEVNYCRNSRADGDKPWCYTIDPAIRWEYCTIPLCDVFWIDAVNYLHINQPTDECMGIFAVAPYAQIHMPCAQETFFICKI